MKPTDKEKLEALEEQYRKLAKIPFKSDEELEQVEQLEKEILFLKDKLDDTNTQLDQVESIEKQEKIKLAIPKDKKDHKKTRFLSPDDQLEYDRLMQRKKLIEDKLKLHNLAQELEKKEKKLAEIKKEDQYVTSKPDKDGTIHLDQVKYDKKMASLIKELAQAKTFKQRSQIQADINQLRMAKVQTIMNNSAIKIGKGAKGIGDFVNQIGKSFGELGKFSGYDEKKSKRKQDDDFGFNESVFKY